MELAWSRPAMASAILATAVCTSARWLVRALLPAEVRASLGGNCSLRSGGADARRKTACGAVPKDHVLLDRLLAPRFGDSY